MCLVRAFHHTLRRGVSRISSMDSNMQMQVGSNFCVAKLVQHLPFKPPERAARIHQEIVDAHLTLARLHAELVAMHQSTTLLSPTYPLSAPHLSEAFKLAHPSPSVDPGPRHPHQLAPSTKIEDDVSVSRADFTEVSSDPQFNPIDDHDSDGIVNSTPISELESESSVEVWPTKDHINGEILYLAAHQQSQQVLFTESCPYIPDPVEWPGAKCPEEDSQSDSEAKGTQYYYSAGRSKPTPRRPLMATIYSDL
ncbi:hypothetical protein K474DRAFT_192061 [Panus rudis PR-1116 ss-1]|nr:hypothetical protein K474DRAFT_192061 [Panus rudis PR-1116 ss-1]